MTDPITAHSALLASDVETLARCAARLRALARSLRADEAAPPWLHSTLDAHLTACTVAHVRLSAAADSLQTHVSALAQRPEMSEAGAPGNSSF